MNKVFKHLSIMTDEIMAFLPTKKAPIFVDATAGGGGHLLHLAERAGPLGHVYAFDRDARAHQKDAALGVAERFPQIITLFHQPFSEISTMLANAGVTQIDGLLCDLGVSSHQLDEASRGFSFMHDGPIDMRMDPDRGLSAYDWLARTPEREIADALYYFGGERKSRAIASLIKKAWPIENSTLELARLILSAVRQKKWSKAHPATRAFQAIRIAVNNEVDQLKALLEQAPQLLAPGGVLVFLSFHSGEDRLIKNMFKTLAATKNYIILTKKPISAQEEEIAHNPRARSAKLRALKRV